MSAHAHPGSAATSSASSAPARGALRRFFRENGLSIAAFGLFLFSLGGHAVAGLYERNEEAKRYGEAIMSFPEYLTSGAFMESVFENWESEFLQIALFVILTELLRQKGSSESKKLEGEEACDEDPRLHRSDPNAPWPVRRGGWVLKLYEHSLCLVLFGFFFLSFVLHAVGGAAHANEEHARHGEPPVGVLEYVASPRFWFESFQNWQSEFLAVGALIVLSIFLRQRGSPQSKRVAAPHGETGGG